MVTPPKPARGLTLIEIVLALAVLAILGTLAIPTLAARMDRERLQLAAEMLSADVNEARFEAARQGRELHLQGRGGPQWCWAVATQPDCPCGSGQGCQLRSAREADHPGVELRGEAQLLMAADGRSSGASTSWELHSRRGLALRMSVGPMGRAQVCTLRGQAQRYPAC
jgi:type IV fimbrial biogenesis protein FimT